MGPSSDSSERPSARLSRLELGVCLLISLAVFFLYQGPIWRHRWRIDGAIWYSYLVIPLVVAGVLARARKFEVRELALGTLEVVCWKFGVTYLLANTMWLFSTPPPHVAAPAIPALAASVGRTALRVVSPEETGSVVGSVTGETGQPIAGAVVFVDTGLEEYGWPQPPSGASFSVKAGSIDPRLAVAELHGEVRARSGDGTLHTLIASQEDSDLFSLPLQSSGAWSSAELRRGHGVANLRCAVHERSSEVARLVVVAHPFHTVLDERARFEWSGVPSGRISVVALWPDGRSARAEQLVPVQKTVDVDLVVGAAP